MERDTQLITHKLRSVIILLRRKVDFTQSLTMTADVDMLWRLHIHYTTDSESVSRMPSRSHRGAVSPADTRSPSTSRASVSDSRTSLTSPSNGQPGLSSSQLTTTAATPRDQLLISSPTPCTLHAGGSSMDYGFEYYGPTPHVVMTPTMESGAVAIATALAEHSFPRVSGEEESQKTETVRETAKVRLQAVM